MFGKIESVLFWIYTFPLNAPHTDNQAFKVPFWKLDSYEDKLTVCLCVVVLFQTVSDERADCEFVCGVLKYLGLRDCSHWPQELRD